MNKKITSVILAAVMLAVLLLAVSCGSKLKGTWVAEAGGIEAYKLEFTSDEVTQYAAGTKVGTWDYKEEDGKLILSLNGAEYAKWSYEVDGDTLTIDMGIGTEVTLKKK